MTDSLKVALAQLNPKVGDVAGNLAKVRAARERGEEAGRRAGADGRAGPLPAIRRRTWC